MTGRLKIVSYSKPQGCVDATGHGHSRCSLRGCKKQAYPPENPLLVVGGRSDMLRNAEVSSDFKLIEVRQYGDRYRIVLDTDHAAVKEILRFFSFASQFAHTFFYKSKAIAVSDEKEQARQEKQIRYEAWCIETVLPKFRTLKGTPTEKFRQMKDWLNAQGETLEFMGGRENGYLRAEVESLIYNARKFERVAKKNVNSNSEIPADIVVINDAAGGDVS